MNRSFAPHHRSGHRVLALILALLGTSALIGLGTSSAQAAAPVAKAPAKGTGAWVRAAHLIPGLGIMTIGLTPFSGSNTGATTTGAVQPAPNTHGMRVIASAESYGGVTTYEQIPAGYYTIGVWPAGSPTGSTPLISGTLKASAGQAFTVAGLGTKAAPKVEALADDLTPPQAGQDRVRLLPAASTARTVTVTATGGPAVAQNALFGRPTGYAAVPAGAWTLKTTPTGTGSAATATSSKVDLAGGSVYTLLVLNSGTGLKVTPVVDAASVGTMPAGGAQTGGGWLAEQHTRHLDDALIGTGAGLLVAAGLLLTGLARRRPGLPR